MTARQTTRPQIIETAERRAYVLEQRRGGHSYRHIAALTVKKFGVENLPQGYDERYAWNDIKAELTRLNEQNQELAVEISRLEQERLDNMQAVIWPQVLAGNFGALDRVLRIMERRARLLGLDKPTAVEVAGKDGGAIETKVIDDTRFDRAILTLADAIRKSVPGESTEQNG